VARVDRQAGRIAGSTEAGHGAAGAKGFGHGLDVAAVLAKRLHVGVFVAAPFEQGQDVVADRGHRAESLTGTGPAQRLAAEQRVALTLQAPTADAADLP
jgi:hypothetical protein